MKGNDLSIFDTEAPQLFSVLSILFRLSTLL